MFMMLKYYKLCALQYFRQRCIQQNNVSKSAKAYRDFALLLKSFCRYFADFPNFGKILEKQKNNFTQRFFTLKSGAFQCFFVSYLETLIL